MNIDMIRPHDLSDLSNAIDKMTNKSVFLAGGTDLVLEMNEGKIRPDLIVDVSDVAEMRQISEDEEKITIGASVTFTEISESNLLKRHFLSLTEASIQVGSKQIRNRGTIGGNIGNGSPAGDSLAPLIALGAQLNLLHKGGSSSQISVDEFLTKRLESKLSGSAIVSIVANKPKPGSTNAFFKLGSRKSVTIARLNMAVNVTWDDDSKRFEDPTIVLGALGKKPLLAHEAEKTLAGKVLTPQLERNFAEALSKEVDRAIPTRSTRPYKHSAIRGLADDFMVRFR